MGALPSAPAGTVLIEEDCFFPLSLVYNVLQYTATPRRPVTCGLWSRDGLTALRLHVGGI